VLLRKILVYFSGETRYRSFGLRFRLRILRGICPVQLVKSAFTETGSFAASDLASIDGVLGRGFKSPPLRQISKSHYSLENCELKIHATIALRIRSRNPFASIYRREKVEGRWKYIRVNLDRGRRPVRSPSFSRFSSSTTITIFPARMGAMAYSMVAKAPVRSASFSTI
jgi:hypothetical protein